MWDNIQCDDPLPNRSFGSISNIREHPNEKFLGSVADNICDALSLKEDLLRSVQIQQAVSLKRILHMQDISSGEYIELLKNT